MKPQNLRQKQWGGLVVRNSTAAAAASTGAVTYVFKRQDYGRNDPGHKNHDPQHAEETLALGEVHLPREELAFSNGRSGANARPPLDTQPTFVWKQKTVTQMQTIAVMPIARNTTLVS